MNRVEKLERALEVAMSALKTSAMEEYLYIVNREVGLVLNPPPAYEDVEVEHWAVVAPSGFVETTFSSEARANHEVSENGKWPGYQVAKLTGTYKRPLPAPVEKTAHGTATASGIVMDGEAPAQGTRCVVMWEEGAPTSKGNRKVVSGNVRWEDRDGYVYPVGIGTDFDWEDLIKRRGIFTFTWEDQ